jgi:muconolactone delta-isomerase
MPGWEDIQHERDAKNARKVREKAEERIKAFGEGLSELPADGITRSIQKVADEKAAMSQFKKDNEAELAAVLAEAERNRKAKGESELFDDEDE